LLQQHVVQQGNVNYQGFIQDKKHLLSYLSALGHGVPDTNTWTRAEQLAYWINAYNAFTVKLIVDHYPLQSIKDLNSKLSIPFINSVWDQKFILLGGKKYSLNNIEHGIIRQRFAEPRIHFAVNCASVSCPRLRREAYAADCFEQQLQEQTYIFLNDSSKNNITANNVQVSRIFDWYGSDFTRQGNLVDYINQYSKVKIKPGAHLTFMPYDWRLNKQ